MTPIKEVTFVLGDALEIIAKHSDPAALLYCDPPYINHEHQYRKKVDLKALLKLLKVSKAKIVLSGNSHFSPDLKGWWMDRKLVANNSSPDNRKMEECVYTNFPSGGIRL